MTDRLHDPAWCQQEPGDDDGNDGYGVQCDGCGMIGWVATVEEITDWYCPVCIGEETDSPL